MTSNFYHDPETTEQQQQQAPVATTTKKVPPRRQQVIDLWRAGKDPKETAEIMGITPGSVRSHRMTAAGKGEVDIEAEGLAPLVAPGRNPAPSPVMDKVVELTKQGMSATNIGHRVVYRGDFAQAAGYVRDWQNKAVALGKLPSNWRELYPVKSD